MSNLTSHLTATSFGETDALLSMTHLRCAAEGGRNAIAIIDQSDPLAMLAAKR